MTPDQLRSVASSLRSALTIVETQEQDFTPEVTIVGRPRDAIVVRFERRGSQVRYICLGTDESLRGKGKLFESPSDQHMFIYSTTTPQITNSTLFVQGTDRLNDFSFLSHTLRS